MQAKLVPVSEKDLLENGGDGRGELWVKGPQIMKGYWKNPTADRDAFGDDQHGKGQDRWMRTGDVCVIDEDGDMFIVDRVKELIKYKGFQVPPADLEDLLSKHPDVADVAVIGVELKEQATEAPRAYIVPKPTADMSTLHVTLAEWVASRVADHKKLRGGVRLVQSIPKSESGKILRKVLREEAKAEEAAGIKAKLNSHESALQLWTHIDPIRAGRWPEDIAPEISSLFPYLRNNGLLLDLSSYPGGFEVYDRYFERTSNGFQHKPRVQVIKITYGDAHITDRAVLERFYNAIKDYQSIVISNENLGGDPKPNVFKEFVIEYQNLNNIDNRCIKRRRMREGETLDFGWDIKEVLWGAHPFIWSLDKFPKAFESLFWALDHDTDVLISGENMDCDPSPGQGKYCWITYSDTHHNGSRYDMIEGHRFRFTRRWGEPKKEGECVVM
ncbi:hypothetical protein HWV62_45420 [Athelia sp. TMB]|nr:hypothetical protein HWV62_45420 [Athelia sp. TMB]